jgi:hypothetical protein
MEGYPMQLIKKQWLKMVTISLFFVLPLIAAFDAFANALPEVPDAINDALLLLPEIFAAVSTKQWAVVAALAILIFVFLLNKYIIKAEEYANKHWLPLVSAGTGILIAWAAQLYGLEGDMSLSMIGSIILNGLFVGAAASGFWDIFVKFIQKQFFNKED